LRYRSNPKSCCEGRPRCRQKRKHYQKPPSCYWLIIDASATIAMSNDSTSIAYCDQQHATYQKRRDRSGDRIEQRNILKALQDAYNKTDWEAGE